MEVPGLQLREQLRQSRLLLHFKASHLPRRQPFSTHLPARRGALGPPPTYDVEHAEGASAMLMQPGVHTGTMELMEAGNDPELLEKTKGQSQS